MEYATLSGRVVDAASQSKVAGAQVTLMRIVELPGGVGGEPRHAVSDADGCFTFDRLRPGRYRVDVEKPKFAPSSDPFDATSFDLTAGQSVDLQIPLERGGILAGGVRDAEGEPLPEIGVFAMRLVPPGRHIGVETIQGGVSQTNDLGEFRIAKLAAGDYLVIAAHQPRMLSGPAVPGRPSLAPAPTYYPGTSERRGAQVVPVRAGETAGGLWFAMVSLPAFSVSGVVVDEAGVPLGGGLVTLLSERPWDFMFTPLMCHANEDGTFEIDRVIPGTYHISAAPRMDADFGGGGFEMIEEMSFGNPATSGVPDVVFRTPSGEQPNRVVVESGDVRGIRVVASSARRWSG
jgi:carboxypeptidase family protein